MGGTCTVKKGARWYVVAYGGVDPKTGKKRQKWHSGFSTKREADAYRAALANHPAHSAGLGLYGSTRRRLGDYLTEWLRERAPSLRQKTHDTYEMFIRVHIAPELGHIPLARLSPMAVQEFYSRKLASGLSGTTVHHIAQVLDEALSHAVKWGLIARNPADQTEPPKRLRAKPQVWSVEQVQQFVEEARRTSPYYLAYAVALAGGLRQGEIFGLRWSDVDLASSIVRVSQTLERPGRNPGFGDTKTDRSHRSVLLPVELVTELRHWKKRQAEERLKRGAAYRDFGLVFAAGDGGPLHPHNIVRRDFHPLVARLGLPRITFHGLRHVHATLLVASGVDVRTVSDRLGHASAGFTLSVYAHALPGTQEKAAQASSTFLTLPGGLQRASQIGVVQNVQH